MYVSTLLAITACSLCALLPGQETLRLTSIRHVLISILYCVGIGHDGPGAVQDNSNHWCLQAVTSTALKLIQSMKRDWMQTGRRPSGLCGAALFIASHMLGCGRTKMDIVKVVHVGWGTLEKRVMEFAQSNVGDLTVGAFEELTTTYERDRVSGKGGGRGGRTGEGHGWWQGEGRVMGEGEGHG